jgi:hypothetical protein
MRRLYIAILYLCLNFGEVRSLLDLADSLDMDKKNAWRYLDQLKKIDRRLRVVRIQQNGPLVITYEFEPGAITNLKEAVS